MKYPYGAASLLASNVLHTEMRSVSRRLLDALAEEESRHQEETGAEDIVRRTESQKAIERMAVDYIALVKLYVEAIRVVFPKSSN